MLNRTRKIFLTVMAALALMLATMIPAQSYHGGGSIHHRLASNPPGGYMVIAKDWCGTRADPGPCNGTPMRNLYRDQYSTRYWKDTDGFYIPSGCNAYHAGGGTYYIGTGPRWVKMVNGHHSISIRC